MRSAILSCISRMLFVGASFFLSGAWAAPSPSEKLVASNENRGAVRNETTSDHASLTDVTTQAELLLTAGETHLLAERGLKRIAVGNGKIVAAKRIDRDQIMLLGQQPGTTTLHLWFVDGSQKRILARVNAGDNEELLRDVRRWLGPKSTVEVKSVGGRIVIEGKARSAQEALKIRELAQRSPLIVNLVQQIGVEQMIAMEVRFLEVKKSALENIGINWQKNTAGPVFGIVGDLATNRLYRPASSGTVDASGVAGLVSNLPGTASAAVGASKVSPFAVYFGLQSTLASVVNLMEQQGDAVVLAEPILSCRSGGSAKFLAGGEIPLPTTSAMGATSVQFKPYGIKFEINPTLTESGSIAARVMTELSAVDPAIKVGDLPAFLSRQTETEVNLREGETLVISGLIAEDKSKTIDKLALLGDIPILGKLFQSDDFRQKRSEMVVFVTPRFISPDSQLNREISERISRSVDDASRAISGEATR